MIRTLQQLSNLKDKRVLVRVDFNVPMKNKKVLDDTRIKASVRTINYLRKKGAKVIVLSHLGRPEGKILPELSLKPLLPILSKILTRAKEKKLKILLLQNIFGEKEITKIQKMKSGEVVIFENIRFYPEEEKNDEDFARQLASLADVFVLDGFSVAHRAAASVSGVAKYLPSYAGFSLTEEVTHLDALMNKPKKPFVAIIGGAKIETKLPVVKNILKKANTVLVGGAIVNSYWKAKGYGVGASLVDEGVDKKSLSALAQKQVILPFDVIVGDKQGRKLRVVDVEKNPHQICLPDEAILDIGPGTVELFVKHIGKARTLVWNGAMGYFEVPSFATGTFEIARALAVSKCSFTLVGGGETLLVMDQLHVSKSRFFSCTGGGAMLEFLSQKKLPGIEILKR